ncbi:MAG: hypothetical protein AAFO98_08980, partial [Pseudomonadota bacterium]
GVVIIGLRWVLEPVLESGFFGQLVAVPMLILVGAGVHFAVAFTTGALDRSLLTRLLRRRG